MIKGIIAATNPNYKNASTPASRFSIKSFTLIELIVVIIIVGILAAVGMTQYSSIVEKSRLAEAKIRIGVMRQLAYQYYLENGSMDNIQNANVGVDNICAATGYYSYWVQSTAAFVQMFATRCSNGGKTPNAARGYNYYMNFWPATGQSDWHCYYTNDSSSCFGLSP